jgi:regulator of protease activity HflC (stomatin/prohibitin superfamily)
MASAPTLFALLLLIVMILAFAGLRLVPSGRVVTVRRRGRYVRTLMPGLHWVLPGIDRIACEVSLIGHHLTLPARPLGNATARTDLYFQILEPLTVGERLEQVDELVQSQASQALDAFEAEATPLPSGLAAVAESLKAELNRRAALQGLRIIRCSISASA